MDWKGCDVAAGKKPSVILWTGLAAATAGVVAVAVFINLRERSATEGSMSNRLRDVQDVLTDCYKKITEIEQHLPELSQTEPLSKVPIPTSGSRN